MKPQLTGKALVAAGHLLAKQIGPNTPLKDISALISSLATHLDVALVRGDLLQQQANKLAAENVKATEIIAQCKSYFIAGITNRVRPTNEGYLHMLCDTFKDESPATYACLLNVQADAIDELWKKSLIDTALCLAGIGTFDKSEDRHECEGIVRSEIKERVEEFAAQFRAQAEELQKGGA